MADAPLPELYSILHEWWLCHCRGLGHALSRADATHVVCNQQHGEAWCRLVLEVNDQADDPTPAPTGAPLTTREQRCVALLAEAMSVYAQGIVGTGSTRDADVGWIHVLQNAVLAQAAARAYPNLYRLAGETLRG